jgi:hypothetical protein
MLAANSRLSGHPIENRLNGHQDRIVAVTELFSVATALLGNWTSMEGSVASQLFESNFKRLTNAVQARYRCSTIYVSYHQFSISPSYTQDGWPMKKFQMFRRTNRKERPPAMP